MTQNEATDAAKIFEQMVDAYDIAGSFEDDEINAVRAALKPENAGVPAGYKLVPIEPTREMMEATKEAFSQIDGFIAMQCLRTGSGGIKWTDDKPPLYHAYKAMIAAAPPVAAMPKGEWLPIETAPKDGRRVMLWNKKWTDSCSGQFYGDGWGVDYNLSRFLYQPTHWQLLPTPPAALVQAGEDGGA